MFKPVPPRDGPTKNHCILYYIFAGITSLFGEKTKKQTARVHSPFLRGRTRRVSSRNSAIAGSPRSLDG